MIINVSFPAELLLSGQTTKRPYKILVDPLLMLAVLGFVLYMLIPAAWIHLQNIESWWPYIFEEPRKEMWMVLLLLLAVFIIAVSTAIFTWHSVKSTVKFWRQSTRPNASDYGLMDGVHFGDGTVEITDEGITLCRELLKTNLRWDAIKSETRDGKLIGIVQTQEQRLKFGEAETEELAVAFAEQMQGKLAEHQL